MYIELVTAKGSIVDSLADMLCRDFQLSPWAFKNPLIASMKNQIEDFKKYSFFVDRQIAVSIKVRTNEYTFKRFACLD